MRKINATANYHQSVINDLQEVVYTQSLGPSKRLNNEIRPPQQIYDPVTHQYSKVAIEFNEDISAGSPNKSVSPFNTGAKNTTYKTTNGVNIFQVYNAEPPIEFRN